MTVRGGKIVRELEGLPGGRPLAEGAGKAYRRNKTIIADPYCLSRITCKYFGYSEMETSRLCPRRPAETVDIEHEVDSKPAPFEKPNPKGCGTRKSFPQLSCRPPAKVLAAQSAAALLHGCLRRKQKLYGIALDTADFVRHVPGFRMLRFLKRAGFGFSD